jgi:hypothetical protein
MFRFTYVCWLSLTFTFMLAVPALSQSANANEQSAYVALYYTPVAGLPPLAPSTDTSNRRLGSGLVMQGRVGEMSRRYGLSLKTMGVGIELPVGHWSLGGTLAYLSASCGPEWAGDNDCAGDIMIGGSARRTLLTRPLGDAPAVKGKRAAQSNEQFLVGFEGSAGFSPRQGEQALAISAGLPLALAFRNGDLRIVPFITPGLGYGRLGHALFETDDFATSHGSLAPMVGGGIGLEFGRSGLGATLGFQKVFKSDGGTTQLGLGMTWQGVPTTR